MKFVKMLGLAAMAAMALMAFAANTASATIIEDSEGKLNVTDTLDASLTGTEKAKLEVGSTILDECSGGTVKGAITNEGGAGPVEGEVKTADLTWENCTRTTTTTHGGTLSISWTSGANGTLSASNFEVTVATIFGSCVYGYGATPKSLGEVKGGTPATLAISTSVPKISGPCPGTSATWTANYTVTSPTTLNITNS